MNSAGLTMANLTETNIFPWRISKPVIVAGSIDRPTQIATLQVMGAAGFTVGTSALDGRFPAPSPKLADQLDQIMNLI